MRKLIYSINVSLDGCCDHTKMSGDEETHGYFTSLLHEVDVQLFGRKTYELMVPYWPDIAKNPSAETKSDVDFAQAFASKQMVVVSRSLPQPEDKNTRVIRANLKDEVLKLKQQPGKPILCGGVNVAAQLIELGLVDEFRLVLQPILVGGGTRLAEGIHLAQKLQLKLTSTSTFKSGSVALHYAKQ